MHWIDRGDEPSGLCEIREDYTEGWVNHYRHAEGEKPPSDRLWSRFRGELRDAFSGICGYCEERPRGQVDHFRPKSKFPELVYEWHNWIFSCADCNSSKLAKWPRWGYVDPCARSPEARPENYFDFDLLTGEILPQSGLSRRRREKVWQMILDLKLNSQNHRKNRMERGAQ